ncbi:WD repeat-containing protein 63 isoform X1 [Sander lucioperca]|uniref:Dynein axonemal intermediate chain 3 n=1 Tax=Sander lucioperca TaxID=283035 RepID=A0A8D0AHI1_SANLU|nr:WD repeat-containing protein 63 isoform X1 [Sander lucioperca]XP_031139847.1 WD repeat-containing protein 63 isoform X1 [Sander lucioperca]
MPPKKPKSGKSSAGSKGKGKKIQSPAARDWELSNQDHPEDIFPMVLTSATQELFDCQADEDVTGESPYKLLEKDDIIQDIKTRAAVSDFSPVKQIVLDYPEDELLLVYDRDFTYGQSFYLVLTPEAKDRILNPPKPETPEVFEKEVVKTPEPKPWISLGSDKEIDEEAFKESREKLLYKFSRVRRKFGVPVCFSDRNTADAKDDYLECASYQDSRFSIKQMQRDCGMQAVPRLQSSSAQTQWKFQKNIFTQYTPRELSVEEKENILQLESLKNFCNSVTPRVLQALQQEGIMNVFFDDWKALGTAADDGDWAGKVSEGLMLYQAFTDQKYTKDKKICSINWHPTIYGVIAVALTEKKEEQLNKSVVRASFILFYTFSDPSNPQLLLECPDDIFAFEFCPSDPNIIVGGCINGQVVLWDISAHVTRLQGTQPGKKVSVNTDACDFHQDLDDNKENKTPIVHYCAVSALESSHKAPITDVQWLPTTFEVTRMGLPVENMYNISAQVVTCSPDCTIMFWDVRVSSLVSHSASERRPIMDQKTPYSVPDTFKHLDRTWKPLFRVSLPKIDTSGEYAPLKFNLEHYTCNEANENGDSSKVIPDYSQLRLPSAKTLKALEDVNTKLYIGTEDGEIIYTDWKLGKDDSGRLQSAKPLHCFSIHHWLVNTVQRSPFFKDIILTAGSWNFAIWKEGVMDGPIILSAISEQVCTVGCWSLSRPAVFFIGKEDGSIEVWNLLEKTNEPVQIHSHVTNAKITCIKPWAASSKQHFLAVTDDIGMVRVFEIPKTLYVPSRSESLNVKKYFELEEDRLKDFLRREELWEKEKEAEELKKRRTEPDKPVISLVENEEVNVKEYNDYLMLEESVLKGMGLWQAPADTQDN